jgi:hypothetical protein
MWSRRQLIVGMGMAAVALPSYSYGLEAVRDVLDRGPSGAGAAVRLDANEQGLIAAMAEGIIPATDTPGALGAGVPDFMSMLFSDWLLPDEQTAFRTGLKTFDAASQARFGRSFSNCSQAQQTTLLTEWDHEAAAARRAGPPPYPPFAQFKALTVVGYYTSEVGQNQELHTVLDAGERDPNGPVMMPVPFRL